MTFDAHSFASDASDGQTLPAAEPAESAGEQASVEDHEYAVPAVCEIHAGTLVNGPQRSIVETRHG